MSRQKFIGTCLGLLLLAASITWFANKSFNQAPDRIAPEEKVLVRNRDLGVADAFAVVEKAKRFTEAEPIESDEGRSLIQRLEAAVGTEQQNFDAIREQTLAKTHQLQTLRDTINLALTQGESQSAIDDLNTRFESEARELQRLQLEMNEAYVMLQSLQEQVVADLTQELP